MSHHLLAHICIHAPKHLEFQKFLIVRLAENRSLAVSHVNALIHPSELLQVTDLIILQSNRRHHTCSHTIIQSYQKYFT